MFKLPQRIGPSKSSSRQPVFVLVTSESCPACHNFLEERWPTLQEELQKLNFSEIKHIQLPHSTDHPEGLDKYVSWFPTMMVFSYDSWHKPEVPLNGEVFGGVWNEEAGRVEFDNFDPEVDKVVSWAQEMAGTTSQEAEQEPPKEEQPKEGPRRIFTPVAYNKIRYRKI